MDTPQLVNQCTVPIGLFLLMLWNFRRRGSEEHMVRCGAAFVLFVAGILTLNFLISPFRSGALLHLATDWGRKMYPLVGWIWGVVVVLRSKPRIVDGGHPRLNQADL
jgi:hypothetical protein